MSVKTFDELLNIVKSDLEKEQNIKGDTIPRHWKGYRLH